MTTPVSRDSTTSVISCLVTDLVTVHGNSERSSRIESALDQDLKFRLRKIGTFADIIASNLLE
jgi:hypothetical protein